jgi:predicted nucleotidyltransferase
MSCDSDEWTFVTSIKRRPKVTAVAPHCKITKRDAIEKLKCVLGKHNPRAVFLYGSTANGNNRADSDIDVLVIWNSNVPEDIQKIRGELITTFDRPVDLVSMVYAMRSKRKSYSYGASQVFVDNVYTEGIPVFPKNDKDDIYSSYLIGKCK